VGVHVAHKADEAALAEALRRLRDVTRRNYSASAAYAAPLATPLQPSDTLAYALGGYTPFTLL
jgi:hypothetical protein